MAQAPLSRILIVEDDPDIQAVARVALEALGGFVVAVCSSGREALTAAPSFAPDLFLLDVMMPDMDGPMTLRHLRAAATTAHVPIVFMTARVQQHEVEAYKHLGAVDVIRKPFDPVTLPLLLNQIWDRCHD